MPVDLYNKAYHFTHAGNLRSIARHGLLAHTHVADRGLGCMDISDPAVQQRRANIRDPFHRRGIHEYVPLYLNPLNAMLYRLRWMCDELVMLAVDIDAATQCEPLFTDGNAACDKTWFGTDLSVTQPSDEVLRAQSWINHVDGKRRRCAEMLLPDRVPVELISGVYCDNTDMRRYAQGKLGLPASVQPDLFFNP